MCEAVIIDVIMDGFAVMMTVFIIAAIWGAALLCRKIWEVSRVKLFKSLMVLAILMVGRIAFAQSPAVVGQWSQLYSWPEVAIHMILLPDGRILTFTDPDENDSLKTPASGYVVTIPTGGVPGAAVQVSNGTDDIFCSGATFFEDGRVLVAGGTNMAGVAGAGTPLANIFNWKTTAWSKGTAMHFTRWYPDTVELSNGQVLVLSGSEDMGYTNASIPELSTGGPAGTGPWTELTTANKKLTLYPRGFLAPNGKVFVAPGGSPPGANNTSYYLGGLTSGTPTWSTVGNDQFGNRFNGTAVQYAPGKILIAGGTPNFGVANATNTAELINLETATPAWKYTNPMAFPRQYANSTILPDGTVLVTGGTGAPSDVLNSQAVLQAELWNPTTAKWTTMASMNHARLYHSTAALLPDGRVLSGGTTAPGVVGDDVDIYSPPYLFNGARPTITSAPVQVPYGTTFTVATPDAATISQVNLLSLAAVTHAFNEHQSRLPLTFTVGTGSLTVTAPKTDYLAPPGYYMLFILNGSGVPSVATMVQIVFPKA